jgi:hypothetical protein
MVGEDHAPAKPHLAMLDPPEAPGCHPLSLPPKTIKIRQARHWLASVTGSPLPRTDCDLPTVVR